MVRRRKSTSDTRSADASPSRSPANAQTATYARQWGGTASSSARTWPADGSTMDASRDRAREASMVLPAASQVRALLDAVPPRWRAYVAVCAFAGLRLGEASALRVADVDFLRRTITVARQVQGYGTAAEVRAPKYGSERTVYAAPGLTEILAAHVAG